MRLHALQQVGDLDVRVAVVASLTSERARRARRPRRRRGSRWTPRPPRRLRSRFFSVSPMYLRHHRREVDARTARGPSSAASTLAAIVLPVPLSPANSTPRPWRPAIRPLVAPVAEHEVTVAQIRGDRPQHRELTLGQHGSSQPRPGATRVARSPSPELEACRAPALQLALGRRVEAGELSLRAGVSTARAICQVERRNLAAAASVSASPASALHASRRSAGVGIGTSMAIAPSSASRGAASAPAAHSSARSGLDTTRPQRARSSGSSRSARSTTSARSSARRRACLAPRDRARPRRARRAAPGRGPPPAPAFGGVGTAHRRRRARRHGERGRSARASRRGRPDGRAGRGAPSARRRPRRAGSCRAGTR